MLASPRRRRQDGVCLNEEQKRVDMSRDSECTSDDDLSVHGFFESLDGGRAVEKQQQQQKPLTPEEKQTMKYIFTHCGHKDLLRTFHTWKEKVLGVLHVVHCREVTQFNPKLGLCEQTRFCDSAYNVAYFDHDKESEVVHETLVRDVNPSQYCPLDNSVNIISVKVAHSDVRYPISIYGTVLVRDQNDCRCVYLFRRGRDDPQLITKKNRKLALTGPYRALGSTDYMYFEFDLKIKGEGEIDEDFSKGLQTRCAYTSTPGESYTYSVQSCLSTVDLVCVYVPKALEASIGVNFLNGKSTFTGKILASTSGSHTSKKMVLYDSQVAGTKTGFGSGGSVSLSRRVVSVRRGEDLLLFFCARDSYNKSRRLKFVIGNGVDERACDLGTYKLQLKIIWKGVFRHQVRQVFR